MSHEHTLSGGESRRNTLHESDFPMTLWCSFNRLFWKLLLALLIGMALSIGGAVGFYWFTGHMPPPPVGISMWGVVPVVPMVSAVVAVVVVSLVLAWYLSYPLRHLNVALQHFSEGRLGTRVGPMMRGRTDEIADLAQGFDRMATRIEQLLQANRTLLQEVSHELRSPLMRIQVAIDLLRREPVLNANMVERIELENNRLGKLIEELLTLQRLESGPATEPTQDVNVIELLQSITDDAHIEARASQQTLRVIAPDSFVTKAIEEQLYRAFQNVISNAMKYSPSGSQIDVIARIENDGRTLVTTVRDRGPGVPPDMLEAIFEPFIRIKSSKSVPGTGLGLAIARRAMLLNNGSIVTSLRDGGGLAVTLSLLRRH